MWDYVFLALVFGIPVGLAIQLVRRIRNACEYCGSWRVGTRKEWFDGDRYTPRQVKRTRTCGACGRSAVRIDWWDRNKRERGRWQAA